MTAAEYLREDGTGAYANWHVPDLVPVDRGALELLFLFESPHVEEVTAGVPVVGASGRDALRFLLDDRTQDERLGSFVRQRLDAGDGRIAIMNVCNVAMQAAAYGGEGGPDLSDADWALIGRIRRSTSRSPGHMRDGGAREAATLVLQDLGDRLANLGGPAECRVVAAGVFAQRMAGALPPEQAGPLLRVPHPSYNQWNRVTNQRLPDLIEVRRRFTHALS